MNAQKASEGRRMKNGRSHLAACRVIFRWAASLTMTACWIESRLDIFIFEISTNTAREM